MSPEYLSASALRTQVITDLAGRICMRARETDHALRVAVTGITASGKSTLTAELVQEVTRLDCPCVRIAVDGFHNPKAVRYRRGRDSAEGYYRDAYDYERLLNETLIPLGRKGDARYVERVFDLQADEPIEPPPHGKAGAGFVVLFDGSFLLRPEIRDRFDYRIFVHASFGTAETRGVKRDLEALGGLEEATRLYRQRYHAAQRTYLAEARPFLFADVVFANDDAAAPVLFVRAKERPDKRPG